MRRSRDRREFGEEKATSSRPRVRIRVAAGIALFAGWCALQGEVQVATGPHGEEHLSVGSRAGAPADGPTSDPEQLAARINVLRLSVDKGPAALGAEEWANAANNLGLALMQSAELSEDPEVLFSALTVFDSSLRVWTRERFPNDWAGVHMNIGATLVHIAAYEMSSERARLGAAAYEAALRVFSRDEAPLEWAAAQNGLGRALLTLSRFEPELEPLRHGIDAFRAAWHERTRAGMTLLAARSQSNLGDALQVLAERTSQPPCEALLAHVEAMDAFSRVETGLHKDRMLERVRADLDHEHTPTRESCPEVPESVWARIGALAEADAYTE